ncbi:hypothetical protein [Glaciimonas soli]|uniref:hypothetical protein n=1 Tax=Glaciimonas soli TaxID=2590999 RepID=UPI001D175454|nr:hypothetical protein [Glaciimonas soli]
MLSTHLTSTPASIAQNAILIDINAIDTPPEMLLSAVLQRISRYITVNQQAAGTTSAQTQAAEMIEHHLHALSELPCLTPVLRATCQQLSEQWTHIAEQVAEHTTTSGKAIPSSSRPSFIARLIYGDRVSTIA